MLPHRVFLPREPSKFMVFHRVGSKCFGNICTVSGDSSGALQVYASGGKMLQLSFKRLTCSDLSSPRPNTHSTNAPRPPLRGPLSASRKSHTHTPAVTANGKVVCSMLRSVRKAYVSFITDLLSSSSLMSVSTAAPVPHATKSMTYALCHVYMLMKERFVSRTAFVACLMK